MKLRMKFNLAILVVFLVGLAATAVVMRQISTDNARAEVLQEARIMLAAADAIRKYTIREIEPITSGDHSGRFLAESVPSYAAQTNFLTVQKQFPDYSYKEATLNPTNPIDRATDWEADIVNLFRNKPGQTEFIGERQTANGLALTLARPITITDPNCLACHTQAADAPKAMIAVYGGANGFGWHLNETIGAQIVSVPMSLALHKGDSDLLLFIIVLAGAFAVMTIVLNVLLSYLVARPVVKMAGIAEAVSLGKPDVPEFEPTGNDEIASLGRSFNRLRRSLESAMKMLGS